MAVPSSLRFPAFSSYEEVRATLDTFFDAHRVETDKRADFFQKLEQNLPNFDKMSAAVRSTIAQSALSEEQKESCRATFFSHNLD